MNKGNLAELLEKSESERLEFKSSLSQINEIVEIVSSFANKKGGKILIGVSNSGKVVGVQVGKDSIERLTNKIRNNTEPKLYPTIFVEEINGKKVIVIGVEAAMDKSGLAFGKPFKRVGKSTLKMSKEEFERMVLEKKRVYWDEQICREASLKDIDWGFVKKFFMPKYESLNKRKIVGSEKELLEALGCIKDKKPTNAGILLFGKNPQKFFMNSYIALARYRGDVESTERLDYREFAGNLFQQIGGCDGYMKEHIAIMSRLHPMNVEREDISEYPPFSIRELIVNAACHRDYPEQGSKIIIKMFNSHIDYFNPGGLPKGVTPQNILKMQKSRNPAIAKVLSKVKYIEELGEGWNKIMKEYKTHPLRPKKPKIEDLGNAVFVTIYRAVLDAFERFKDKLNERQIKLVKYLQVHESITSTDYAKMFGITDRQARGDLSKMVSLDLLFKEGKARLTKYSLYPEISGNIRKMKKGNEIG